MGCIHTKITSLGERQKQNKNNKQNKNTKHNVCCIHKKHPELKKYSDGMRKKHILITKRNLSYNLHYKN